LTGFMTLLRINLTMYYNPLPEAKTLPKQIIRFRKTLGLSQTQLAGRLGVDPGTVSKWEMGSRKLKGKHLELVQQWLKN